MSTGLTADEDTQNGLDSRNWDNFDQALIDPQTGQTVSQLTAVPGKGGLPTTALTASLSPDVSLDTSTYKNPNGTPYPDRIQAVGNVDPSAFIAHHTSGRGTIDSLKQGLKGRGLGVEYAMDRDGNIFQIGNAGASNILPGWGPKGKGLNNKNIVGMEIIANNDADVTQAQQDSFAKFMALRYPTTPIFGHGEVNPGHKEADEGQSTSQAALTLRAKLTGQPPPQFQTQPPGQQISQKPTDQQPTQTDQQPATIKAETYGPKFGETKQTIGAFGDNPLQDGDYAVSNDLAAGHKPFETFQFQDGQGNWHTGRYADKSYLNAGHPNTNTIEAWNGEDFGGQVHNLQWSNAPQQTQSTQPSTTQPTGKPGSIMLDPITVTGETPKMPAQPQPQVQQPFQGQNYYAYGQPYVNYMGPGSQPSTPSPPPWPQPQVRRAELVEPEQTTAPPRAELVEPPEQTTPPRAELVEPNQTTVPRAQLVEPEQTTVPRAELVEPPAQTTAPRAELVQPPQTQPAQTPTQIQTPTPTKAPSTSTWASVQNPLLGSIENVGSNLLGGIGNVIGGIGNAIGNAWEHLWNIF